MKLLVRAALVAAVASTAAGAETSPVLHATGSVVDESQRFSAFLESVYQQKLADSPQLATEVGARIGDDRWDDTSEGALAAQATQVRASIREARAQFDYARLDPASQLQYRVFLDEQQLLLDRYRWRDHFYALNQIVGLHIDIPGVLAGAQPLESEEDARAYVRRISAARPALHELIRHMRSQAEHGIFIPKSVYPLLIEGARNVVTGAPYDDGPDSEIFADFKRRVALLDISAERKTRLMHSAVAALRDDLQPAYKELIELLEEQGKRTPVTGGVWQLPDGDAFYAFLVRQFTTSNLTPAEVHELGLQQVMAVHAEIAGVMRTVGFGGSVREFMAQIKADPRFYSANTDAGREQFLARAREIVAAMQSRITTAFLAPAPLPLEIRRTQRYKEAGAPSGFYEPGSDDGRRPGVVYLNLSDMRLMPLYELEDLLYHEGLPGHHMQISTIQLDPAIPKLRKINEWWQDTAFVEGWALYAERLGKDMGFYRDPYADLGRLTGELWRACRLVVDTGLHYKRWSRDEAIRYLQENSAAPDGTIVREVDRYIAVPGEATAFTVGMLKLVSERERAKRALGPKFDLREYHRIVLENGYLPLWAVEERVSRWISSEQGAPQ